MNTYAPVLKKRYANDVNGIINIRITRSRKSTYKSLKITLPEKYWNKNAREVRANHPQAKELNIQILNALNQLREKSINPTSYLEYHQNYIDRLKSNNSISTSKNYHTTLSHLTSFTPTLDFEDITLNLLYRFDDYLKSKSLKLSSRNIIIANVQRLYRLSLKEGIHKTYQDPFLNYQFKTAKSVKRFLSINHLNHLIKADIPKNSNAETIRNEFLTQIFLQGIRISDFLTLQYRNIKFDGEETRISYKMAKTDSYHSIKLTIDLLRSLIFNIDRSYYYSLYDSPRFEITINDKKVNLSYSDLINHERTKRDSVKFLDSTAYINYNETDLGNYSIINKIIYKEMYQILFTHSLKFPNSFLSPFTNPNYFKNFDFDHISLSQFQYGHIRSMVSKYNNRLKLLNEYALYIDKITSHIARHTYANLLLEMGVDIYSISKLLGHQNLQTTQSYVSDFNQKRIDIDGQRSLNVLSI